MEQRKTLKRRVQRLLGPKYRWLREQKDIYLYKIGSLRYKLESLLEFFDFHLAVELCPNTVRYELGDYHGSLVSKCKLFTSEKQAPFSAGSGEFQHCLTILLQSVAKTNSGECAF
ncbi:hypothetical protein RWV98_18775 [Agathobaculum sp. NTUH-O15-33]|uniref:hypothetical protein n=1 Tax=Agathobaculum sp. NTUH-O15-33 TaxID=3079302 RepID=UPI00295878C3|nr:hypothetical protein [Agathobaculum sp. NTUH-O15-33]WNX84594.1 hypothetical protein RWV98_18775 [Agathobaculum sp. NTUH-O15-33]